MSGPGDSIRFAAYVYFDALKLEVFDSDRRWASRLLAEDAAFRVTESLRLAHPSATLSWTVEAVTV